VTPPVADTALNVLLIDQRYRVIKGMEVTLTNRDFSKLLVSDENGRVSFTLDYSKVSFPLVLSTHFAGFTNQVKVIDDLIADTINPIELSVLARELAITFDSEQNTELSTRDGAYLYLPANALVDLQGEPVTGQVQVYITPLNTSSHDSLQLFPGKFAGTLAGDNTIRQIATYGTTEFYFEQNGQPLNMADGYSAIVELPIYTTTHLDDSAIGIEDLIDLWSLDELTGLWLNEGQGRVVHSRRSPTSLSLRASVDHLLWWNADSSWDKIIDKVEFPEPSGVLY